MIKNFLTYLIILLAFILNGCGENKIIKKEYIGRVIEVDHFPSPLLGFPQTSVLTDSMSVVIHGTASLKIGAGSYIITYENGTRKFTDNIHAYDLMD